MSDVDLINGTITVSKGKNYVTRCIPISDSLLCILKDYLNNKSFRLDDYLFVNHENNKITYYNVYKVFKSSIDKYNKINNKTIKTRLHDLRHSFMLDKLKLNRDELTRELEVEEPNRETADKLTQKAVSL